MKRPVSAFMAALSLLCLGVLISAPRADVGRPKKRSYTFAKDVAPIIYDKCANCHHVGEVAPFALTSYSEVHSKAKTIAAVAEQKFMPPWQAISHGQFSNDRTLTGAQIEILKEWADNGAPAGDLSKAPSPPVYSSNWRIGKPDFIGSPTKAYAVAAEGADEYRCFVVPTHFGEDRFVTDVELRPGSRKVVHHILVYVDTSGQARKKDGQDGRPGYSSFGGPGFSPDGTLGGWAPGLQPMSTPPGCGMWLPKGADIVLQVHYHKDGKQETDLSSIGLKFSKGPVDKKVRWESIGNVFMALPAGAKRSEVTADMVLATSLTLFDVIPHMHLLGHDMRVTATLPSGLKQELIHVDNYDFNWQTRYIYRHPVHLPKGTRLQLVAHYDNSIDNPHNSTGSTKAVHFGEQTTDEMCFAFFSFTLDEEHLESGKKLGDSIGEPDTSDTYSRIFDQFDSAHAGLLDRDELTKLVAFYRLGESEVGAAHYRPENVASFIMGAFGKAVKGKMSKPEFIRMANEFSN